MPQASTLLALLRPRAAHTAVAAASWMRPRANTLHPVCCLRRLSSQRHAIGDSINNKHQPQSSDLDSLRWREPPPAGVHSFVSLTKARLAALVVLTTMAGYAVAPMATSLSTLMATTAGTGLCVASANSFNQWMEAPYDAQMRRTKTRVLVTHSISGVHAFTFGVASGIAGVVTLYSLVNPLTAALGLANIALYAGVYTPMKRFTIWNTWVGAIVGAIPPVMGWTACTASLDAGALLMGAILFAWQFPHFNALSWNLRPDYSKAGYHMMSVVDPDLNARVSLRYAIALIPLCALAPMTMAFSWAQLVKDSSTRSSVVSRRSTSDLASVESDILRHFPKYLYHMDEDLKPKSKLKQQVKRTPTCVLKPFQFFVGVGGVLKLAFTGFPVPLTTLKEEIERVSNTGTLADEREISYWPVVDIGALASANRTLTMDQLEVLSTMVKKLSARLRRVDALVVTELSYVMASCKSLEKSAFRADVPLNAPARATSARPTSSGATSARRGSNGVGALSTKRSATSVGAPVDFICDDQLSGVSRMVADTEDYARHHATAVSKPGFRMRVFRAYCQETVLVLFVARFTSLMEVIGEFRRAVDKLYPGFYDWFEDQALHVAVRCIR
ncbi:Protoheme IX farnesyltransferase, mitochondrial [Entophlyctis luteolus]|nr:Protoheme IX farnesyltransferase, mitochondrial [Entophlyctis luteolus]